VHTPESSQNKIAYLFSPAPLVTNEPSPLSPLNLGPTNK
jgi:hypothetical protein